MDYRGEKNEIMNLNVVAWHRARVVELTLPQTKPLVYMLSFSFLSFPFSFLYTCSLRTFIFRKRKNERKSLFLEKNHQIGNLKKLIDYQKMKRYKNEITLMRSLSSQNNTKTLGWRSKGIGFVYLLRKILKGHYPES